MTGQTFADRLRASRVAAGLSQAGLAARVMALGRARVSVSHGFVSHLEAGRRYPSPRVLDALAVALEMQPSALEHGANLWTGVFADGRLAATSAETVGDACRKLARAGELVMLFAGEPVPVWRAT